ncbi:hypothetical protein L5515_018193 [Caenorhabditis briggsae]|uniref:Saposin B-type domain-containing protein n=1 Tax=Caenorhabditis briggsae TaxID=6238 RepID=A0AAE9FGH4_CAEBR|nr:hypothetical protein L5515_018193 [Caenorhabditis briggsae]
MTNIRIGVFPLEKDAQTCFEVPTCKNPGAEVEVLQLAFRLIGVNYTIVDVWKEFGQLYDFGAKQADGSWSGMIGLLQTGQLDMIGLSMRMSSEREEAVLFSYPTRVFESVFVIAPPSFTCTRQFIFNAFSRTVWMLIVFFVLLLYLSDLFINYFKLKGFYPDQAISKYFVDLFSTTISSFIVSSRVLLVVTLFTTFMLSQLYQTDMYAFLSAPLTYDIPFRTIKQALDVVDKKKMFFAAFENQSFLCTPNICNRYEQVIKKNPVKRGDTSDDVESLILMVHICNSILIFLSVFSSCIIAHPHKTSVKDLEKDRMLTTNEYYVEKVNQMAGISCDLCMRAVYGVNYDFIQLKKDVIEMIRLDCEALFHDRAEDISECIRFLTTKVEKYSGKVEKILDSRHVCVLLRVCAVNDEDYVLKNKMINSNKTDMMLE